MNFAGNYWLWVTQPKFYLILGRDGFNYWSDISDKGLS